MSSNFYKNNEVAHEVQSSVSPMFLPHFDIFVIYQKNIFVMIKKGKMLLMMLSS